MDTPNKIYLEKDKETGKIHHLWGDSAVIHSGYEHIEYVNKKVLLDWLKERERLMTEEIGYRLGVDDVIEKIESM